MTSAGMPPAPAPAPDPHGPQHLSSGHGTEPGETPGPELLAFGPARAVRPRSRRSWLVLGLVVAVLLAGAGLWRFWPRPAPDLSLADLQGAYLGMVRSDGTNDVSTLTADKLTDPPVRVQPASCAPLFDATLSNQFPATALDGVSTYWLNEGSASISLVTYRYPDPDTARRQYDQVSQALGTCRDVPLDVDGRTSATVAQQDVTTPPGAQRYLSYVFADTPATARFSTDVAQLGNTVTWQYRYDYRDPQSYSPQASQQLMTGLISQLTWVQDSHRRR